MTVLNSLFTDAILYYSQFNVLCNNRCASLFPFLILEDLAQDGLLNRDLHRIPDKVRPTPYSMLFFFGICAHILGVLFPHQCRARAIAAITGVGSYIAHSYFNYQYYAQFAFGTKEDNYTSTTPNSNTNILVIRNEHIVEDWNKINVLLEGHYGVLESSDVPRNNVSLIDCEPITVLDC